MKKSGHICFEMQVRVIKLVLWNLLGTLNLYRISKISFLDILFVKNGHNYVKELQNLAPG